MEYKYWLPSKDGNIQEFVLQNNSLIIIGANGSGKSKLGAWIEIQHSEQVHRICAQRSLVFGDYIVQKSYEQSTNLLMYGQDKPNSNKSRWPWDGSKYNYTSSLLNDYEHALSALLAKKSLQHEEYIAECKQLENQGKPHNPVPEMVTDKLIRIWNSVFPQRNISIKDGKVTAILKNNEGDKEYPGRDMSDGERVALYLIAQALSVPNNKILIVDEPEIHLHRSIMNRLWTAIEDERQDCLFIYITHDTQFAANHQDTKKIWVKSFDGTNWDLEEIKDTQLPEQLLLDILGNRKPVIFVEGTADSYDTKLYSLIFNDYYVIACGSCNSVITRTKAMNNSSLLHHLTCFGIIDRDYRSEFEISKLQRDKIYTLKVAEVENLFLVPELLCVINKTMGYQDNTIVTQIQDYIIEERFKNEINRQVCESVISEIKYKLTTVEFHKRDEDGIKLELDNAIKNINYDDLYKTNLKRFDDAYKEKNYKKILEIFNRKELIKSVGHFWKINDKEFCNYILRQTKTVYKQELVNAIAPYLPTEIQRHLTK